MLIDVAIPGDRDRNVISNKAEKILKYKSLHNRNSALVESESKSDTGNNRGDWKHLKITQTVPEQHPRKARN